MFNKRMNANIKRLDEMIAELSDELKETEEQVSYDRIVGKLEALIKLRNQLGDSAVKESNKPAIISGAIGLSAILIVLNYEKTDIITSKAYGLATNMFRGF